MKKILLGLLVLFAFTLSSCDKTTSDIEGKSDTPTGDETPGDTTPDDQVDYVKDGDVVKYFKTFGDVDLCADGSDFSSADCYAITVTFKDGMNILMQYYDIPDSVYKTFDFIATKDGATLISQIDYDLRLDPSINFSNNGTIVQGYLKYNGFDQSPMLSLEYDYDYTESGDNAVELMQVMLNAMILNLNEYYLDNIGGTFISLD